MFVDFNDLAFTVDFAGCKHAGTVQIEPRVEHVLVKPIDQLDVRFQKMTVAQMLPDNTGVFTLRQGVLIALARA